MLRRDPRHGVRDRIADRVEADGLSARGAGPARLPRPVRAGATMRAAASSRQRRMVGSTAGLRSSTVAASAEPRRRAKSAAVAHSPPAVAHTALPAGAGAAYGT